MGKKNISAFAASTAFFLFLSLIPMLMLLCALIPYTPLTEANLMTVVTAIAPRWLPQSHLPGPLPRPEIIPAGSDTLPLPHNHLYLFSRKVLWQDRSQAASQQKYHRFLKKPP